MQKNQKTGILLLICAGIGLMAATSAQAFDSSPAINRLVELVYWLVIIAALTVFGIVLMKRQKQVEERKAHQEIRILMETARQTEEMWQDKYSGLESLVKEALTHREKTLKREFKSQIDRYIVEINKLRAQNMELKESMGQLMQALKKNSR